VNSTIGIPFAPEVLF